MGPELGHATKKIKEEDFFKRLLTRNLSQSKNCDCLVAIVEWFRGKMTVEKWKEKHSA
jgi:hypothetical protein